MILALENKYYDKMEFIIVDVDSQQGKELSRNFGVYTIPAYFFIKNKQIIYKNEGQVESQNLESQIRNLTK